MVKAAGENTVRVGTDVTMSGNEFEYDFRRCQACGVYLDRDINAAVNVATAAGLAVTACRAQIRPGSTLAQRGEAGTHPKSPREPA